MSRGFRKPAAAFRQGRGGLGDRLRDRRRGGRLRGGLGLVGSLALLLASCATRAKPGPELELLGLLDPLALAYVRLGGAAGLGLAPALLPPEEGKSLAPLLERSESLALALLPPAPAGGAGGAAGGAGGAADMVGGAGRGGPRFEAALAGAYPRLSASLALGASKEWKREKGIWKNAAAGVSAVLPDGGHILAASGDLGELIERFERPLPSPLPAALAGLGEAGRSLLIWLPRPFGGKDGGPGLFAAELELPLRGLLIAGNAAGTTAAGTTAAGTGRAGTAAAGADPEGGESFELVVAFLMDDPDSARIYAPAVRLAWYFLCRGLFPGERGLLEARFERREELLAAAGLRVSARSLSATLSRLGVASP